MYNSDDYNWKDNDNFRSVVIFSKATAIAMLSPVAVVGNAIILATIWRRTFPRTTFHILLSGIALNDLCTGLIAQPCYAASFLISPTKDSKVKDNPNLAATLRTVGEATGNFFVSVTILTITAMSIERWLYMSRGSFITSRRRYVALILMLFLPILNVIIRVLLHQNFRFKKIYDITMVSEISFFYVIILFAYYKVYKIIRHHQQQIKASEVSTQRFGQNAINLEKYKRSVATMIYILLLFSLCFIPFTVAVPVDFITRSKAGMVTEKVSVALVFLSSSLSPVLYFWRMRDIRASLKQLLTIHR